LPARKSERVELTSWLSSLAFAEERSGIDSGGIGISRLESWVLEAWGSTPERACANVTIGSGETVGFVVAALIRLSAAWLGAGPTGFAVNAL
jgi:hypothetical protein